MCERAPLSISAPGCGQPSPVRPASSLSVRAPLAALMAMVAACACGAAGAEQEATRDPAGIGATATSAPSSGQTPGGGRRFHYERAWALSGPCCGDSGHDIAVEPDGSFFIVGNYGALDLDRDGAVDQRSEGGHDAIIMKTRPSGDLAWVRAPRSPAASYARLTVAPDRRGGAYIAGAFIDSLQFRSGQRIVGRGPAHGLLARYSAEGDPLWGRAIGGGGTDIIVDAATDAAGHVYLVASVQGAVDLDGDGRPDATVAGGTGLLVASYDLAGALRWARVAASRRDVTGAAIAVTDGAVQVAGHYRGDDVDLDGDGRADLPPPGEGGAPLLAHFDAGGTLTRAAAVLGPGDTRIGRLAFAANGDVIASGYTEGAADLDGDAKADVTSAGGKAVPFVSRFGRGGELAWVRAFPSDERVAILDMASHAADRVAVSGLYERRLDLDGDGRADAPADPDGRSEGFIAILDHAGHIEQVLSMTGPGHDQPRGVAWSPDGETLSITGFARLNVDFDGDGRPEGGIRCDHYGDIVWARYRLRR